MQTLNTTEYCALLFVELSKLCPKSHRRENFAFQINSGIDEYENKFLLMDGNLMKISNIARAFFIVLFDLLVY